jgi:LysM repeat protein
VRIVQPGDTLYSIALACGYRDASIIDVIVAENELASADSITVGEEIIVPPPTAVGELGSTATETPLEGAVLPQGIALAAQVSDATFAPGITPTATLQAGVQWHIVQSNETMLAIAVQYGVNAEILSQLNPEVPFLQCDFEFDSGGPRCIVQLIVGQQIRVPAPTATPTIPPTPSGSETPTPTSTPTFNAPSSVSPGDRALFQADQLVTLRWVTTGTLNADTVYRVRVRDLTANREYAADTRELFFIVPTDWQGQDQRRHEFEWSVSVVSTNTQEQPIFSTQPRIFIWESRPGS